MLEEEIRIYKLFISHLDGDDEEYKIFLDKLSASYDFEYEDCAVQGEIQNDELLKQMEPVDVVVILSGLYSKDRELIQRQIDTALGLKKPIVIIRPYGMENIPPNLEEIAREVVGWNTPCIVDAILESSPYDDFMD
jgi:hypothetical protein